MRGLPDWWVRLQLLMFLDEARLGPPSYELLLNMGMRAADADLSRVAASNIFLQSRSVFRPYSDLNLAARLLLRNVGLIRSAGHPPSLIPKILSYSVGLKGDMTGSAFLVQIILQRRRSEFLCKQRFETDIDAFVVSLDSLCALILRRFIDIAGTPTASYGSALGAGAPSWLVSDFPDLIQGFSKLHALRIPSPTAHPHHTTGAPNKRITRRQYDRVRKDVLRMQQLETNCTV